MSNEKDDSSGTPFHVQSPPYTLINVRRSPLIDRRAKPKVALTSGMAWRGGEQHSLITRRADLICNKEPSCPPSPSPCPLPPKKQMLPLQTRRDRLKHALSANKRLALLTALSV